MSASTQNQALSAILFLHQVVLDRQLGAFNDIVRAQRPVRLPVVLSRGEVASLLSQLQGSVWLSASLMYGAGLRLLECMELRVKDIDFDLGGHANLDRITVWLDVQKEDGTRADVTVVPFKNQILAAGTDFRVVYRVGERRLEDLRAGQSELDALLRELEQCFFDTQRRPFEVARFEAMTCFKTEQYNSAHPDVDVKVYANKDGPLGNGHDVPGLIVAIPGKASLMFDLAREASKHIR